MKKFTKDQQAVIDSPTGQGLMVSASAGSGKTTVMIQKIATLLASGVSGSDILVVTFTKESARDMRDKLRTILGSEQTTLVNQMSVGTFHSFCSDLVKTYFTVAEVNPSFSVLDDVNASIYRSNVLDTLIDKYSDRFSLLIESFCTMSSSEVLKKLVIDISEFLEWQPENWAEEKTLLGNEIAIKTVVEYYSFSGKHFMDVFPPDLDCHTWAMKLSNIKTHDDIQNITSSFSKLKPMSKESEYYTAKEQLNDILKKIRDNYSLVQTEDKKLVQLVLDLTTEYNRAYSEKKLSQNFLDFRDLEIYAEKVLYVPEICERVRTKYKHIFVDEYQDTNPAQEKILNLISGGGAVSVVGDIKQSIYAFRGTSSSVFLDRLGSSTNVIYLNKNFRSTTPILRFVNNVFSRIMRTTTAGIDYEKTSMFEVDKQTSPTPEPEVVSIEGGTSENMAAWTATKIRELINDGAKPEDITILSRERTGFDTLCRVLSNAGIKTAADQKVSVSELYEICLLNNMLLLSIDPEYKLARTLLMRSFVFGFSPKELITHFVKTPALTGTPFRKGGITHEPIPPFEKGVSQSDGVFSKGVDADRQTGVFDPELSEKLAKFDSFVSKYHEMSKTHSVVQMCEAFLSEFGVINTLLATPYGEVRVKNIYTFLNKIRGASYADTVAQYTYMLINDKLDLKIQTAAASDAVRIMTIHGSKGLEFPIVFLYDAGRAFSSKDKRKSIMMDRDLGLCVYGDDKTTATGAKKKQPTLSRLAANIVLQKNTVAEEMRLLYVALTRAKDRLYIIGTQKSGSCTDHVFKPSDFDILQAKNYLDFLPVPEAITPDEVPTLSLVAQQSVLSAKPDPLIVQKFQTRFAKLFSYDTTPCFSPIKVSVTALSLCDGGFSKGVPDRAGVFLDGVGVDQAKGGAEYGTLFHRAMQTANYFDEATKQCAEITNRFLQDQLGTDFVTRHEVVLLDTITQNNEPTLVQGVIDLLAVGKNRAIIIDYKTTRAPEQKLVELYKPQLDLYAKAVTRATNLPVESYIYSTRLGKLIFV
ncbi:MAG: UvrD-helicase domain-containing protein [Firmicutes bacterium]|nr:UvrD-helicase domain-containing protein [Bacillota bacterium]